MKRLPILATLLILTACAAVTESPTPTASPSPTATTTITPSPTVTRSTTPSSTLPIPTPVFPASQVAHSLILSTGASPTCELPCWHDLQIGASTEADVEHVFSELFGAEEGFDFFAPPPNPDSYLEGLLNLDGVYAGGHNWYFEESETGAFGTYYLYAYMDENTGLLSGIIELINSHSLYEAPTLPEIFERLGKPDWLYGGRAGSTFIVDLYYEQGINIQLSITFMLQEDYDTVMICFDKMPISGGYSLTEPFIDLAEEGWSPIVGQVPQEPAPYIDEDLRVSSIDEFMEFVNSEYPCFEMPRFE